MLAGVAGRTIEEARENMSVDEVLIWQAYIAKNGPLAMQRRLEYTAAQTAVILANQNRDPKSPPLELDRFLMWSGDYTPEAPEDELLQVVKEIKKVAAPVAEGEPRKRRWKRKNEAY